MGAGASAAEAVTAASDAELKEVVDALPAELKAKLKAALEEPKPDYGKDADGWTVEYAVAGMVDVKDVAYTSELVLADAKLQVVEEPRAPSFTVMGLPTATTEGNTPPPEAKTKLLYWLARFESKDAYVTDHKNRASNQVFAKKFMACFKDFPEGDGPPDMKAVMAAGAKNMAGSCEHLGRLLLFFHPPLPRVAQVPLSTRI